MSSIPDLFAFEPDRITPRLRETIIDPNGGRVDPTGRGPRWAGWYEVTRRSRSFVVNINHRLVADLYGFHLHFWPGQGVHYSMPPGGGESGPATVFWTREWLYLHYQPDVPVFRAYSGDSGQWTEFDRGYVGALVFAPYPQ
jgi:hypothetical protein